LYGTFDVKAVLVSFFVRPKDRFFALTGDITLPRAGAVKAGRVGGHPKGAALIASSMAASSRQSVQDRRERSEGSPLSGATNRAASLYSADPKGS
jgi:hypothetical protein